MKARLLSIVAALAMPLAVPTFAMADHHGGRGDYHGGGWGHDDHRSHGGNHFSFSVGLGAFFTPSYYRSYDYDYDAYRPIYRSDYYYAPAPVYAAPVYAEPACAAPVYVEPAYAAPVYVAPACSPTVVYAAPPVVYYSSAPRYYYSTASSYSHVGVRFSYRR